MTAFRFTIFFTFLLISLRLHAQYITSSDTTNHGDRLKMGYVWKGGAKFNPLTVKNDYEQEIIKLIFGMGLFTKATDEGVIHGLVMSSETQSPQVLRFQLRPNIFFHDGTPIVAEDVKFSYELYRKFSLQSPSFFNTRLINSIEVWGKDVIRFRLDKPIPNFSETLGQLPILPKKYYEKWMNYDLVSDLPYIEPVGLGYYKLTDYTPQEKVQLDVFSTHTLGRGNLQGIDILFYETYDQLLDAFLHEKLDFIPVYDRSVLQKLSQFAENILSIDNNFRTLYYINLNTQKSPFKDISIRKALNYSINKSQIVETLINGNSKVAYSLLSDETQIDLRSLRSYEYLPLEGLRILTNNNFRKNANGKLTRNNKEFNFEFYFKKGSPLEESMARLISINLGELGINVIPRSISPLNIENRLYTGNYDAALQQFYFKRHNFVETFRRFYLYELNRGDGFQNFRIKSLNLILNHLSDSDRNEELVSLSNRFQYLLNQYSPCIFLFFEDRSFYAINPRFENVTSSYNETINKMVTKFNPKNEWYVPKEKQKY